MGMFDNIRCHYPLPDGFAGDLEYQTKDTEEQFLCHYTITEDGRLILHSERYEDVPENELPYPDMPFIGSMRRIPTGDVPVDFHGALTFYTGNWSGSGPNGYITNDGQHGWWREYTALFDHGKLLKIEGGITYDKDPPIAREQFFKDIQGEEAPRQ